MLALLVPGVGMGGGEAALVLTSTVISREVTFVYVKEVEATFESVRSEEVGFAHVRDEEVRIP